MLGMPGSNPRTISLRVFVSRKTHLTKVYSERRRTAVGVPRVVPVVELGLLRGALCFYYSKFSNHPAGMVPNGFIEYMVYEVRVRSLGNTVVRRV